MKAAIIVFPGTNRERDAALALEQATGKKPVLVWHRDSELPDVDLILLPGGFSYGDYLRCGSMAANSPIMNEVIRRAQSGTRVLGICNGFQILTETRLVPGALLHNASLKFICRDVHLKIEHNDNVFTGGYRAGQVIRVPVAHGEGNYFAEPDTLEMVEDEGLVAFRYCGEDGAVNDGTNPNGSVNNIAGVFNKDRTILGMMPHPEDAINARLGGTDGAALFTGMMEALS